VEGQNADYRIEKNLPFAAIYADLDNFKAYNDAYGFLKGDVAIKLTADILSDVSIVSDTDSFLGHIGGDDFIVIVKPDCADSVCQDIIDKLAISFGCIGCLPDRDLFRTICPEIQGDGLYLHSSRRRRHKQILLSPHPLRSIPITHG
jgi:GGDEF domain-containing protein